MATSSKSKSSSHASYAYLFKNGYGMFVKTFQFPPTKGTENESIELLDPPLNPVHGTFWIQSTSNHSNYRHLHVDLLIRTLLDYFSFNQISSYEENT